MYIFGNLYNWILYKWLTDSLFLNHSFSLNDRNLHPWFLPFAIIPLNIRSIYPWSLYVYFQKPNTHLLNIYISEYTRVWFISSTCKTSLIYIALFFIWSTLHVIESIMYVYIGFPSCLKIHLFLSHFVDHRTDHTHTASCSLLGGVSSI